MTAPSEEAVRARVQEIHVAYMRTGAVGGLALYMVERAARTELALEAALARLELVEQVLHDRGARDGRRP